MKLIVTGGAGFIGSALINLILKGKDYEVLNLDKLTYAADLDNIQLGSIKGKYNFVEVDICDQKEIARIFKDFKPDSIIHLAAESHVDRSISDPSDFINTNILGTYNLLEESLRYLHDSKNKGEFLFHHVSTDEVFGDLGNTESKFTENSPYMPSSPYSASKASSDHLVRAWNRTYGLPTIITNCSNNYGPNQHREKFIPTIIFSAINWKKIPVYGDGKQIRDWLFVEDHALGIKEVLLKGEPGQTYNIGGNSAITNIDLVHKVCDCLDEIHPSRNGSYHELVSFVEDRKGHDRKYAVDTTKISNELGWQPIESFESGLRKTVQWYLSQNIVT